MFDTGFFVGVVAFGALAYSSWAWHEDGVEKGVKAGRARVVRECPAAQHNQILLQSIQHQDGRVFCQYADTGGWSKKSWKETGE